MTKKKHFNLKLGMTVYGYLPKADIKRVCGTVVNFDDLIVVIWEKKYYTGTIQKLLFLDSQLVFPTLDELNEYVETVKQ